MHFIITKYPLITLHIENERQYTIKRALKAKTLITRGENAKYQGGKARTLCGIIESRGVFSDKEKIIGLYMVLS